MTECDCAEFCWINGWADQFQPATRELMVFTKSPKRYFDLDAVREPYAANTMKLYGGGSKSVKPGPKEQGGTGWMTESKITNPIGAPPLDWWQIPSPKPQPVTEYEGDPMTATFYVGDAIETMNKLPEKSVDLILTSPPFLALRSYLPADHPDKALEGGSQSTPGEYIDWLIDVVEACDRVLAPHGSLCIELGDTYSGSGGAGGDYNEHGIREGQPRWDGSVRLGHGVYVEGQGRLQGGSGWPLAKSLSLIPETFRFAMVYGFNPHTGRTTEPWRLRNVIRWVRPNPPVGALGDKFRPATSELMVFCKSAKRYFDLDAVRNPDSDMTVSKGSAKNRSYSNPHHGWAAHDTNDEIVPNPGGAPPLDWWNIPLLEGEEETRYGPKGPRSSEGYARTNGPKFRATPGDGKSGGSVTGMARYEVNRSNPLGAPPLDWWNIPPGGYEGAHYAVWPPELCVKPVKAMCPEKVCRQCGEPSRRIVEQSADYKAYRTLRNAEYAANDNSKLGARVASASPGAWNNEERGIDGASYVTTGFSDCGHDDYRPGLVLDPFAGSGTTLAVATGHGRDAIGIDLDERNYELALQRVGPFILERAS